MRGDYHRPPTATDVRNRETRSSLYPYLVERRDLEAFLAAHFTHSRLERIRELRSRGLSLDEARTSAAAEQQETSPPSSPILPGRTEEERVDLVSQIRAAFEDVQLGSG